MKGLISQWGGEPRSLPLKKLTRTWLSVRNEASDMWSKEMIEAAKARPAAIAKRIEAI